MTQIRETRQEQIKNISAFSEQETLESPAVQKKIAKLG